MGGGGGVIVAGVTVETIAVAGMMTGGTIVG